MSLDVFDDLFNFGSFGVSTVHNSCYKILGIEIPFKGDSVENVGV